MPAAGGDISDLQAQIGTAPAAGKSAIVDVLDETPAGAQSVAMSCTIAATQTTCSNTGTVAIAAGHYLMVQIDGTSTAAASTWRVTFRY